MLFNKIASSIGRGVVAGFVGTAAMTITKSIEARVRQRDLSTIPGEAVERVFGLQARTTQDQLRFSNTVHFAYGTAWGVDRGLLGAAGFTGVPASLIHFGLTWGATLVLLSRSHATPSLRKWGIKELSWHGFHYLIYAFVTGIVYDFLERDEERPLLQRSRMQRVRRGFKNLAVVEGVRRMRRRQKMKRMMNQAIPSAKTFKKPLKKMKLVS